MSRVADGRFLGKGNRFTTDFIAGVTRTINRRTVAQLNFAFGLASGYMTDPYKVFSVVDAPNGVEWDQYFEGRPDSRNRWSITATRITWNREFACIRKREQISIRTNSSIRMSAEHRTCPSFSAPTIAWMTW